MVPQIPHPVKNTGSINKATLVVDRHTFYMHSDIDGCTCLVSDCLFRVHQSRRDSWENLASHILWRVAAASDSQAIQSSGTGRREGVLQRTEEGRRQHTLLGLNGEEEERSAGGSIVGHVQLHCNISAEQLCLKQRDG